MNPHSDTCECSKSRRRNKKLKCKDAPASVPPGFEWDGGLWCLGLMSPGRLFLWLGVPHGVYAVGEWNTEDESCDVPVFPLGKPELQQMVSGDEIVYSVVSREF